MNRTNPAFCFQLQKLIKNCNSAKVTLNGEFFSILLWECIQLLLCRMHPAPLSTECWHETKIAKIS